MAPSEIVVKRSGFPKDFIFGAATSEYQVKGARNADGKGNNSSADGKNGSVALDQYHMFKEDACLMKKVGLNSFNFSISWSRILPGGKLSGGISKEGIKYYNDLIDALSAQGIEPWATLFHWDVPQDLEKEYHGFLDRQIVDHFRDFAEICFWEFGDRVKRWITLNEPWTFCYYGYVMGNFSPRNETSTEQQTKSMEQLMRSSILHYTCAMTIPQFTPPKKDQAGKTDSSEGDPIGDLDAMAQKLLHHTSSNGNPGTNPYTVAHNLILAHAHAANIYRKYYQEHQRGKIGMANVSTWFYPLRDNSQDDKDAASRALDFMLGWFVAPVIFGNYPPSMKNHIRGGRLSRFNPDEVVLVKGSCDFLGINYYTSYYVKNISGNISQHHYDNDLHVEYHTQQNENPQRVGWPSLYIVPEGIYHLMLQMKRSYHNNYNNFKNPEIIITANGLDEVNNKDLDISKAHIDETRIEYHRDHLECLKRAIDHGVCVKGYFIRSLLDNFEWAQRYNVRSGIFYVSDPNGCLTKFPKRSAMWWRNFLKKPE
ncbi:beta-glucosidase-like isoform X2 [Olea europaea var. sylvestris]|nr:beta-glucosidase-like isoform X2 [Olea europaea var. sylvestris]